MGADLNIPVRVVYEAIRENVNKVRTKVKEEVLATGGHKEVKENWSTGNAVTSKGKESASKPIRWSARVASQFAPRTACKPFTDEIFNLPDDDDDIRGPCAQPFTVTVVVAEVGCSSYAPLLLFPRMSRD
ncbi:hypothetical protein AMTRI_Chr09g17790 [Amborella trichopoda]